MFIIDTHSHLYFKEFDLDRELLIKEAFSFGINFFFLPSINRKYFKRIIFMEKKYPGICIPMIGLHPCSVNSYSFEKELFFIKKMINKHSFIAIGEIGIDFKKNFNYFNEQIKVFKFQVLLAKKLSMPIVIHCRNSFNYIFKILNNKYIKPIKGVFHCFSGTFEQANLLIDYGMKLGIGGIVTFKNGGIDKFLHLIDIKNIVLESDAPYLTPHPYRKIIRNEPSFLRFVLKKLSYIYKKSEEEIAEITSYNAINTFYDI